MQELRQEVVKEMTWRATDARCAVGSFAVHRHHLVKIRHIFLALFVTAVWGGNFVVIRVGLNSFPPILLAALRFIPAAALVPFLPRPDISWPRMLALGLTWFLGQFSLLFLGMDKGMPPGLASVILQTQVFFTMAIAALVLGEVPRLLQIAGTVVALAGLALIGVAAGTNGATLLGFTLLLGAAVCWAAGNVIMRGAGNADMLPLIAWLSLIPPLPLLGMSLAFEGPQRILQALTHLNAPAVGAVLYLAICATILGYAGWGKLLKVYPAGTVTPFSLLIPVVGVSCAWLTLGEAFGPRRLTGMGLILAGVAVATLPRRRAASRASPVR